jgi:hypothetical protein
VRKIRTGGGGHGFDVGIMTVWFPGTRYGTGHLDRTLNGLGAQGWELVAVGADVRGGGGIDPVDTAFIGFFKRST